LWHDTWLIVLWRVFQEALVFFIVFVFFFLLGLKLLLFTLV
jgi:hypothetical protein